MATEGRKPRASTCGETMQPIAYVNGVFCGIEEARVSVEDRGFQLGDGVYEVNPPPPGLRRRHHAESNFPSVTPANASNRGDSPDNGEHTRQHGMALR